MNKKVAIVGFGMTEFGKFPDRTIRTMAEAAVRGAISDAGIVPGDVDQIFFANAAAGLITGQEMIRGQAALRFTGLAGKPIINVENACASGSTAVFLAVQAILSGQANTVLVVGAEKLTHEDKRVSFEAFGRAIDLEDKLPEGIGAGSGTVFMDIYAAKTRKYMAETGATPADFARVVVKSRRAASLNPLAQFRKEITIEDVLTSRMISDPLTLPMCSSIGDGAAALVLCGTGMVSKLGAKRPIWVGSCALVSGTADESQPICDVRAPLAAYERAGVDPRDVDVAEVHDASAPAEIMHYEDLQICPKGGGAELLRSGATDIGGRVAVNSGGGLLSRGHPIGATGVAQLVELTKQLRGTAGATQRPNAKVGIAQNSGGKLGPEGAVGTATILHV